MVLTMIVNIPMNEHLATVAVPSDINEAQTLWLEYSERWQLWNTIRTAASGIALSAAVVGLMSMVTHGRTSAT